MKRNVIKGSWCCAIVVGSLVILASLSSAHDSVVRNENLEVENRLVIATNTLLLTQKRVFKNEQVEAVWNAIDADKDGKLSRTESDAAAHDLEVFFENSNFIVVNFISVAPESVRVDMSKFPTKKPKKKTDSLQLLFNVTYRYNASGVCQVNYKTNLNVARITCAVHFAPQTRIERANTGRLSLQTGILDMVSTDGVPDSFTVLYSIIP